MFTKKDRKIAILSQMVENRDNFINKMSIENRKIHNENKDLRFEIIELKDLLKKVKELSICNTYNNEKAILGKIKELVD